MAPFKEIKTYEKKLKSTPNISTISTTIRKKRLRRLNVKELPPTTEWKSRYLIEDSFNIETENTFDKLLKGKIYNEVQIVNTFIKNSSSDSDLSKSCKIKATPMITRSKSKGARIEINSFEESNSKTQSNSEHQSRSDTDNKQTNSEDQLRCDYKQTSLDRPVDISLSVEKVYPNHVTFSSLSYIKIPKLIELKKCNVVSSTPYNVDDSKSLPNTVSPITTNSDQQQHDFNDISNNITPKLKRRSSRKRYCDRKSRRVLLDDLIGFNDHESQESIEKSLPMNDFLQTINNSKDEIKEKSSSKLEYLDGIPSKVVSTPPISGFSKQNMEISVNDSNQFQRNLNSMNEQQITTNSVIESAMMSSLFLSYSNMNENNSEDLSKLSTRIHSCDQKSPINNSINTNSNFVSSNIIESKLSTRIHSCDEKSPINNSVNTSVIFKSSDIVESSITEDYNDHLKKPIITLRRKRNEIKPGKLYRRSLALLQKFKDNIDESDSIGEQFQQEQQQQQQRRSTLRNSQIIPLKTYLSYTTVDDSLAPSTNSGAIASRNTWYNHLNQSKLLFIIT